MRIYSGPAERVDSHRLWAVCLHKDGHNNNIILLVTSGVPSMLSRVYNKRTELTQHTLDTRFTTLLYKMIATVSKFWYCRAIHDAPVH